LESMLLLALLEQHKKFSRTIDELYQELELLKSKP